MRTANVLNLLVLLLALAFSSTEILNAQEVQKSDRLNFGKLNPDAGDPRRVNRPNLGWESIRTDHRNRLSRFRDPDEHDPRQSYRPAIARTAPQEAPSNLARWFLGMGIFVLVAFGGLIVRLIWNKTQEVKRRNLETTAQARSLTLEQELATKIVEIEEWQMKHGSADERLEDIKAHLREVRDGSGVSALLSSMARSERFLVMAQTQLSEDPDYRTFAELVELEDIYDGLENLTVQLFELGLHDRDRLKQIIQTMHNDQFWYALCRAEMVLVTCAPAATGWFELRVGLSLAAVTLRSFIHEHLDRASHFGRLLVPADEREGLPTRRGNSNLHRLAPMRDLVRSLSAKEVVVDYKAFAEGLVIDGRIEKEVGARTVLYNPADWSE